MLTKSLIEAGVQFRTQVYPDKHHGLVGTQTRMHLYKLITGKSLGKTEMESSSLPRFNNKANMRLYDASGTSLSEDISALHH